MVTGEGPQRKVTTPPLATARTTAAEVQLAAVPLRLAASITTTRPASTTHTGRQGAARKGAGAAGASRRLCAAKRAATSVHDDSFALALCASPPADCLAAASAAFLVTIDPGTTGSEIVPGGSNATCLAALSTTRSDSLYALTVSRYPLAGFQYALVRRLGDGYRNRRLRRRDARGSHACPTGPSRDWFLPYLRRVPG